MIPLFVLPFKLLVELDCALVFLSSRDLITQEVSAKSKLIS
jgi:hypothetical protein